MNLAIIIGNLGADAVVRKSEDGREFCSMRIADTSKWKGQDGREHESTVWHDVVMNQGFENLMPYLKAGVKICAVGSSRLRVYSSEKERCMKASQTVSAMRLELCGGAADEIPRSLIDPNTGQLHEVRKFYAVQAPAGVYVDKQINKYAVDSNGWVNRLPNEQGIQEESEQEQESLQQEQQAQENQSGE